MSSTELLDLLYVAYNRDESDVFGAKRALKAGFEELYTTAPDVFDRKIKLLDKQIEEEAREEVEKEDFVRKHLEDTYDLVGQLNYKELGIKYNNAKEIFEDRQRD